MKRTWLFYLLFDKATGFQKPFIVTLLSLFFFQKENHIITNKNMRFEYDEQAFNMKIIKIGFVTALCCQICFFNYFNKCKL